MKIGVCQLNIIEGDVKANINTIENALARMSTNGLDLICLPELSITGYDFELVKKESVDEEEIFSQLAKKYNINLLAGFAKKENNSFYDMVAIWDGNGHKVTSYKKIHLWGNESSFFTHGNEIVMTELNGVKIGIMICADLGFAEIPKVMALKDCQVLICPAAWSYPFQELFKLMVRARAAENQMFAIGINRAEGINGFCGNSCISDPNGYIIKDSISIEQEIFEVELDITLVEKTRESTPWLKMRLPEVYNKNI